MLEPSAAREARLEAAEKAAAEKAADVPPPPMMSVQPPISSQPPVLPPPPMMSVLPPEVPTAAAKPFMASSAWRRILYPGDPTGTATAAPTTAPTTAPTAARRAGAPGVVRPGVASRGAVGPANLQAEFGGTLYSADYLDRVEEWYSDPDVSEEERNRRVSVAGSPGGLIDKHQAWENTQFGGDVSAARIRETYAADRAAKDQQILAGKAEELKEVGWQRQGAALRAGDMADQFRERMTEYQAAQQRRGDEIDSLNEDLAKRKIDPGRLWNSAGAGSKIISMIGIALGGFAEGFSGGKVKNRALEIFQRAIDRDVAAQRANLQNARASVREKRTLYAMARERFGDDRMAHQWTVAQMWRDTGQVIQGMAIRARGQRLKLAMGKLENIATERAHLGRVGVRRAAAQLESDKLLAQRQGAAAVGARRAASARSLAILQAYGVPVSNKKMQRHIGGFGFAGEGTSRAEMTKLRAKAGEYKGIMRNGRMLVQLMGRSGCLTDATCRGRMESLFVTLSSAKMKEITGAGMSDSERKNLLKMFGTSDPASVFTTEVLRDRQALVQQWVRRQASGMSERLGIANFQPGEVTTVMDIDGKEKHYYKGPLISTTGRPTKIDEVVNPGKAAPATK